MRDFLKVVAVLVVGGILGACIVYVWVMCMLTEAFNR